jgi:hypothetical protein
MVEKVTNDMVAFVKSIAEKRGPQHRVGRKGGARKRVGDGNRSP